MIDVRRVSGYIVKQADIGRQTRPKTRNPLVVGADHRRAFLSDDGGQQDGTGLSRGSYLPTRGMSEEGFKQQQYRSLDSYSQSRKFGLTNYFDGVCLSQGSREDSIDRWSGSKVDTRITAVRHSNVQSIVLCNAIIE